MEFSGDLWVWFKAVVRLCVSYMMAWQTRSITGGWGWTAQIKVLMDIWHKLSGPCWCTLTGRTWTAYQMTFEMRPTLHQDQAGLPVVRLQTLTSFYLVEPLVACVSNNSLFMSQKPTTVCFIYASLDLFDLARKGDFEISFQIKQ